MDIVNLWKPSGNAETDRVNIMKSWLCNASDGQTYVLHDHVFEMDVEKIENLGYFADFAGVESEFDEIIGFKHDYHIDDDDLHVIAQKMVMQLDNLTKKIYEHPENYFEAKEPTNVAICGAFKGIACDYCIGEDNICTNRGECPFRKV